MALRRKSETVFKQVDHRTLTVYLVSQKSCLSRRRMLITQLVSLQACAVALRRKIEDVLKWVYHWTPTVYLVSS